MSSVCRLRVRLLSSFPAVSLPRCTSKLPTCKAAKLSANSYHSTSLQCIHVRPDNIDSPYRCPRAPFRANTLRSSLANHSTAPTCSKPCQNVNSSSTTPRCSRNKDESVCWCCGACNNSWNLFCGTCAYIQPLDGETNYFQLLDLPQSFDVDLAQVEKNFKTLQKQVHPDKYGTKTPKEQALSSLASSKINIAYRLIRNPTARAQYLLQLHGFDALSESVSVGSPSDHHHGSESRSRLPGHTTALPRERVHVAVDPEFLMEMLEDRELLSSEDISVAEVRALQTKAKTDIDAEYSQLSVAFRRADFRSAAEITIRTQYQSKLLEEIESWLFGRRLQVNERSSAS
jgi:molecular chaperone HscB